MGKFEKKGRSAHKVQAKNQSDDIPKLWGKCAVSIFRLNRLLTDIGNDIAAPAGQTSARWNVLGAVYGEEKTVSDIAYAMGQTRQSVQRIADLLVEEGFAQYKPNPRHKRASLVALTAKGRQAMESIAAEQQKWTLRWNKELRAGFIVRLAKDLETLEKVCSTIRP